MANRSEKPTKIERLSYTRQQTYLRILLAGVLLLTLGGVFAVWHVWSNGLARTEERALQAALSMEAGLSKAHIASLTGTEADLERPEYQEIKASLIAMNRNYDEIRYAYLYYLRNGQLAFHADSADPAGDDYSPPGQPYWEADPLLYEPYVTKKPVVAKGVVDRWGAWVSILIPVLDPVSGEVLAVFAIDYPQENWDDEALQRAAVAGFIAFGMILLATALYVIARKTLDYYIEKEKLLETTQRLEESERERAESERSRTVLLANLPGMAYRCRFDREWTMLFISDGCKDLTGYEADQLLDNRELSYNDLILPAYREIIWNLWNEAVAAHTGFRFEYEIRTADEGSRWVYEQGQAVYGEDGSVSALEGLIVDVSDLKEREREVAFLSRHDLMTGCLNRVYFDQVKRDLDTADNRPISVLVGDINGLKFVNSAFGEEEGDKMIAEIGSILRAQAGPDDIVARTGGDEFTILLPGAGEAAAANLFDAIRKALDRHNAGIDSDGLAIQFTMGYATANAADSSLEQAIKAAVNYMNRRKLLERKSSQSALVESIKATMLERNRETEEHGERLAELTTRIARKLELSEMELYELELLATLHDIGKVGIDDRILTKPGRLTEDEWEEMRKHPEIGYRIAASSPELAPIADLILSHHERWDGKGYPRGLRGEEIPLLARILAVADAFDAMTEDRVYRTALPDNEALRELERCAGTQFDPAIVAIFLDVIGDGPSHFA